MQYISLLMQRFNNLTANHNVVSLMAQNNMLIWLKTNRCSTAAGGLYPALITAPLIFNEAYVFMSYCVLMTSSLFPLATPPCLSPRLLPGFLPYLNHAPFTLVLSVNTPTDKQSRLAM